jgi:hypothetical protein
MVLVRRLEFMSQILNGGVVRREKGCEHGTAHDDDRQDQGHDAPASLEVMVDVAGNGIDISRTYR